MKEQTAFLPLHERDTFDWGACHFEKGFAQVQTTQDASYYGIWANPTSLKIVHFSEGDLKVEQYESPEEFTEGMGEAAPVGPRRRLLARSGSHAAGRDRAGFPALGAGGVVSRGLQRAGGADMSDFTEHAILQGLRDGVELLRVESDRDVADFYEDLYRFAWQRRYEVRRHGKDTPLSRAIMLRVKGLRYRIWELMSRRDGNAVTRQDYRRSYHEVVCASIRAEAQIGHRG